MYNRKEKAQINCHVKTFCDIIIILECPWM